MIPRSIGPSKLERLAFSEASGANFEAARGGTEAIEEDTMRSVRFTDATLSERSSPRPAAEDAAKAKALINFLMKDRFFLEHFRSGDPKVRAAALDTLNKAHHQAYGGAPAADGDAASGRH
jgi:hypothetical protein